VAVKVLHKQDLDPKTLAAFRKEVEIMSKIYHPNIVLFMGACTRPGSMAIITELMPKGDLEQLLQDARVKLSLGKRMRMARDAALGMTWLHLANPVIVHRDLKASNLLVDQNYTVKICDFGLSQIKPRGAALRDGAEGAKGTPLWMAPEVMMGEKFNEKADVYSFGIVLWEILTRQEPFAEFDSFEEFRNAVCVKHVRPPIPDSCPRGLRQLISAAWHPLPPKRPTFPQIVEALDQVLVDIAIRDPHGRQMWKDSFLKHSAVLWPRFIQRFEALLKLYMPAPWPRDQKLPDEPTDFQLHSCTEQQLDEYAKRSQSAFYRVSQEFARRASDASSSDGVDSSPPSPSPSSSSSSSSAASTSSSSAVLDEFLHKLFSLLLTGDAEHADDAAEGSVQMEVFGNVLEWFGPIVDAQSNSCLEFLERTKSVCSKTWFHGDLSTRSAENSLAQKPVGSFLIRFSSTAPGCYTISKVSERSISHQRIIHQRGRGFHVNNQRYESLEELVQNGSKDLGLRRACGGSKIYNEIFNAQRTTGYIQIDDE
jgi:serine/threonine protein kinase